MSGYLAEMAVNNWSNAIPQLLWRPGARVHPNTKLTPRLIRLAIRDLNNLQSGRTKAVSADHILHIKQLVRCIPKQDILIDF